MRSTQGVAQELPGVGARHTQVHASQVSRGLYVQLFAGLTQVYVATTKVHDGEQLDAKLFFSGCLESVHQRIVEDPNLVSRVLVNVTSGEDRELWKELSHFPEPKRSTW